MITNQVTSWREQKGVSKAHLARRITVSRSYVTRLEQGGLQPSGAVMFRIAAYFRCRIEEVFQWDNKGGATGRFFLGPKSCLSGTERASPPSATKPPAQPSITPPARPAETEKTTDKSLVNPTAKAVAPSVALVSQRKI